MIVFLEAQHLAGIIEYIQRGQSCPNELRDVFDANGRYPVDIEAIYAAGQRCNLFQQEELPGGPFACRIVFFAVIKKKKKIRFSLQCPIITTPNFRAGLNRPKKALAAAAAGLFLYRMFLWAYKGKRVMRFDFD